MHRECDNVIDYFNGQLTEIEKKNFERHLETCDSCREELDELHSLTQDLPYAVEPVTPPSSMKTRVLDEVFASEDNGKVNHRNNAAEKTIAMSGKSRPWLVPALVAALLLSVTGNIYTYVIPEQETTDPPEETPGTTDQVVQRVQMQSDDASMQATAAMLTNNNEKVLVLQAQNLAPLEGNQVYQVWLLKGEKPYPAGSFVANQNGEGAVAFSMENLEEVQGQEWDAIAISKEPNANSKTPQGKVLMSAGL